MCYRAPTELVGISLIGRSSHQRKGYTSHIIGMVWLCHLPIAEGRERVCYMLTNWFYLPSWRLHRKKAFRYSCLQTGCHLSQTLPGGNNNVIYKLFPPRECLVSDIPTGDGNIKSFFSVYRRSIEQFRKLQKRFSSVPLGRCIQKFLQ